MRFTSRLVVASIALAGPASATIYTDASVVAKKTYDFIVVGAGIGGAATAARIAEEKKFKVLLIEAGGSAEDIVDVQTPLLMINTSPDLYYNWNYTLVPTPYTKNRAIPYQHGFVSGGTSAINFGIWTRSSQEDWDKIAAVTGEEGYSWNSMVPWFKKVEQFVNPQTGADISNDHIAGTLGSDGPIKLTLANYNMTYNSYLMEASKNASYPELAYNKDINNGYPLGLGWLTTSTGGGIRSTSMNYIPDATVNTTGNLDILLNTRVSTVAFKNAFSTVVSGVNVQQSRTGKTYTIAAMKEVILSAGAVATPQILLLSGIGDAKALAKKGIRVRHNNPNVGANFADHPWIQNNFYVNSTDTFDRMANDADWATQQTILYQTNRTGMLSSAVAGTIVYGRVPYSSPVLTTKNDPTAGKNTPHYELIAGGGYFESVPGIPGPTTPGYFVTLNAVLITATSKGSVTLATNSIWDSPIINPNFLATAYDRYALVETVKTVKSIAASPALKPFIYGAYGALATANTDAEILEYAEARIIPNWHSSSSAAIGKKGTSEGVVNPDLTVKGVSGLRVVDASVFPFLISAHTQAGIYAFAERTAAIIKEKY